MIKSPYFLLLALVIVAATGIYMFTGDKGQVSTTPVTADSVPTEETAVKQTTSQDMTIEPAAIDSEPAAGDSTKNSMMDAPTDFPDIQKAMAPRTLGNPDAPIIIKEFASLTCSHCAHFYTDTFPALKEKYIDTGKVFFIYGDFPLNAPALEATLVSRCLPESRYFKFIKFLYSTQDQWAYDNSYSGYLKQNAKLLGLNEAEHAACLNSEELRTAFGDTLKANQDKYEIRSTPTFIINETEKITGAQPLAMFEKIFDKLGGLDANAESMTDNGGAE